MLVLVRLCSSLFTHTSAKVSTKPQHPSILVVVGNTEIVGCVTIEVVKVFVLISIAVNIVATTNIIVKIAIICIHISIHISIHICIHICIRISIRIWIGISIIAISSAKVIIKSTVFIEIVTDTKPLYLATF